MLRLLDNHAAHLRESGLSDETMRAAGLYSETSGSKVAALIGWKEQFVKKCVPVIVFPFIKPDGSNGLYRVRWDRPPKDKDGRPIKYASPKGYPSQVYLPPGTRGVLQDVTVPILLTEGEKKALAADQHDFRCVGLVGVWGWKQRDLESLIPSMLDIAWKGRLVRIAFDSDVLDKPLLREAESRLSFLLAQRGATVKIVRLPPGQIGADGKPAKVGVDDYLVASGPVEFTKLLNAATDPEPPDAATLKSPASDLDPAAEVARVLAADMLDGVPRLVFWRGAFHVYRHRRYQEVQTSEVRARLVGRLNESYYKLTSAAVGNCLLQMQAQALLGSHVGPPAWRGDKPGWPANEVLVCRNGLVHLPTFTAGGADYLRPPTPRFFSSVALDFDFDAAASPPATWLDFLSRLWPDDPAQIETLQEWFGYSLLADTSQEKILMLVGPKRSGKGTIARVLRGVVGADNVAGPTLESLGQNFGLWPLMGKSLAIIDDARLGNRSNMAAITERLLSISGQGVLTIDRKNLEPVTCKLGVRFVILTNELPKLADASGALSGRLIILPLKESWYGREDHQLSAKLLAELPSILLWAIDGWKRLAQRGRFQEPSSSDELRGEMDDLTSPVGAFVRHRCVVEVGAEIARNELYAAYRKWRVASNVQGIEDEAEFGRLLRAVVPRLGEARHRDTNSGKQRRFYAGIKLHQSGSGSETG